MGKPNYNPLPCFALICGAACLAAVIHSASAQEKSQQRKPTATGRMIQQLHSKDWILRVDALEYLAKHQIKEAKKPIYEIAIDDTVNPWLRGRALVVLTRLDAASARELVLQLSNDKNPQIRAAAAEAYQYLSRSESSAPLQKLLKDDNAEVSYRALAALAKRLGVKAWKDVDPMTQNLDGKPVQWAARALALVGNKDSLQRLTDAVRRTDLQTSVMRGIHDIRDEALIGVLLDILAASQPGDARFAAGITALQRQDENDVLNVMITRLSTGNAATIRSIASASTMLTRNPKLGVHLRVAALRIDDSKTVTAVMLALGQSIMKPTQHVELFVKNLHHKDPDIRALAIRGLAHCKNVNLYAHLGPRVKDDSDQVVEAALGALRRTPIDNALSGKLVAFLKSPIANKNETVRSMAYDLLAHAGTEKDFAPAIKLFREQLRGADDEARAKVAAVLGKLAPVNQLEAVVRTQGYVSRWMVVGTFYNDTKNVSFKKGHPPELKIDFKAKYKAKYAWALRGGDVDKKKQLERVIQWTRADVDQTDGKLILPPLLPPPAVQALAYAVADIHVDKKCDVILNVDGDDSFCIWLNGKKVAEKIAPHKHNSVNVVEQRNVKISLQAGQNRFLVKTANIDREWWVRLRLTDKAGRPVAFGK